MDNDVYIPFKFRASQIVGLAKIVITAIETHGVKLLEEKLKKETPPYENLNQVFWFNNALNRIAEYITGLEFERKVLGGSTIEHELELGVIGNWGNTFLNLSSADVEPEPPELNPAITLSVIQRAAKKLASRILLDSEERSHYVQLHTPFTAPKNIRFLAGAVGSTGNITYGTGFTVLRTGVGRYTITLKEPMPAGFVCIGNDLQGTERLFSSGLTSQSTISVIMSNPGSFTPEDITFGFIVVGSA